MYSNVRVNRTGCLSPSQKPPVSYLPAAAAYTVYALYVLYIVVLCSVHDYIVLLNTTIHHFVGRRSVGVVP